MTWNENAAYELVKEESLDDISSHGILLRHKKSGAHVCVLKNQDENKVFSIAFRTPPCDSTGTPHIIEHTVLCGSRKFPLKDPFIELVKGSLNTFLNAMTYPDKTVYPVASCNDQDFQNLMDVYLDSVFYPNIYKNENIFRQEGWHYEIENPEDELKVNGVVFNEMRGAYSSADSVVEREILQTLYPDTCYRFESGGDPREIPKLTYEKYLDFHRTYYHPSNSYIFLYGDLDPAEKLTWLDEAYLSDFERIEVNSEIGIQAPFDNTPERIREYPISSTDSEKKNTYLSLSWSVGSILDPYAYAAFDLLDYVLLNRQGSPIRQALIDAGISDDVYGGYDSGVRQPYFSVIAKNTDEDRKEEFIKIVEQTLLEQAEGGLSDKHLLAGLNNSEFKFREGDYGRFPKGLMVGLTMLDSWIHDENEPFMHLKELQIYAYLRERIGTNYFRNLIRKYLIDNPHRCVVIARPKKGLTAVWDQFDKMHLKEFKESLSAKQVQDLIRITDEVHAFGNQESTEEELETIPILSREDLKQTTDPLENDLIMEDGIPILYHNYQTNGIIYTDFLYSLRHVPMEMVPYLGILRTILGKVDSGPYTYQDLNAEVTRYTGGIHEEINVYAGLFGEEDYDSCLEVRVRSLTANYGRAVSLAETVVLHAQLEDKKRIYTILAEARSHMRSDISQSGHVYGIGRAAAANSRRSRFLELVGGISYYKVLSRIVDHFDEEWDELLRVLNELKRRIFCRQNLLISITCDEADREWAQRVSMMTADHLSPKPDPTVYLVPRLEESNEAFTDASMVQYVSMYGIYDQKKYPYRGTMRVLKTILNYDYLWTKVRVEGGAYGASSLLSRYGDVGMLSFRDPNIGETLEVFKKMPEFVETFDTDERNMTKYVIGTFSEMDIPLFPCAKGRRSLNAWLSGITYEQMQEEREDILSATPEDIRMLAEQIRDALNDSKYCVIGNEERIRKSKELFSVIRPLVEEEQEA